MEIIKTNCIVIGGGVAGLAVAKKLSFQIDDIFLIEKDNYIGNGISSRNSEVIHAGIYYKPDSLKNKFIVEGKNLLYKYLDERRITYNKCGKYIVASSLDEIEKLNNIKENAAASGLNDLFFDTINFKKKYPFIRTEEAIFSPSTGIFDSHSYMKNLRMDFEKNGGFVLLNNKLINIEHKNNNFQLLINDKSSDIKFMVQAKLIINCAGLSSVEFNNMFPGDGPIFKNRYVKGDYYSYLGKEDINHLIYPIPDKDGLGVHVTMDLGRGVRFGPSAYEINDIDYNITKETKFDFIKSIQKYWPSIDESLVSASYSGIRPKLVDNDDYNIVKKQIGDNIMISVLGYESPGLSASLGLAEHVFNLYSER
tara:strand:+ start:532 stop:1629 length:1098 start_codon:yes stop_codon:yes gene_type:complete